MRESRPAHFSNIGVVLIVKKTKKEPEAKPKKSDSAKKTSKTKSKEKSKPEPKEAKVAIQDHVLVPKHVKLSDKEKSEMLDELRDVCEIWKKDVREQVEYRTRKLELAELPVPVLGGVLKALNIHNAISIKYPVFMPSLIPQKHSYFLFLNDLVRRPRE